MNSSVILMMISLCLFVLGLIFGQVWIVGLGFAGALGSFFYAKFFGGY
jgi:hypothetical protein